MPISTFGNKTPEKKELQRVCFNLKNALGNYFSIEAFCAGFICLPLKNQPVEITQKITHICKIRIWQILGLVAI